MKQPTAEDVASLVRRNGMTAVIMGVSTVQVRAEFRDTIEKFLDCIPGWDLKEDSTYKPPTKHKRV